MTFLKDLEKREMEGKPINKEEEMEKFLALKKNITNYFKCTKQFKEKFVEGIEKTDLSLIKRYSQDKPMESSQAKGKKKGKK